MSNNRRVVLYVYPDTDPQDRRLAAWLDSLPDGERNQEVKKLLRWALSYPLLNIDIPDDTTPDATKPATRTRKRSPQPRPRSTPVPAAEPTALAATQQQASPPALSLVQQPSVAPPANDLTQPDPVSDEDANLFLSSFNIGL